MIVVDIKTFSYIINSDVIRLIQNRYFCNNPHGSLRSINEQIASIAYILGKYDKVFVASQKTTDDMLALQYEKNIGAGLFIVSAKVDIVNCKLQITDMYPQKNRK